MDTVNQVSDSIKNLVDKFSENKILTTIVVIVLILYGALAAPKLPRVVAQVFDNTLFKLVYMFAIGYIATKDPTVAIIAAVALLLTIQGLSALETFKQIKEKFGSEEETVQLPAAKAEVIAERTKIMDELLQEAKKAEEEGNQSLAQLHMMQAQKQDIIIQSLVKSEQQLVAAQVAKQNGQEEEAKALMIEAVKQEAKAESIVKAEGLRAVAEEEMKNGNVAKAETVLAEAEKQEAKAEALHKAEMLKQAVAEAEQKGLQEEAQRLAQQVVMEEAKAEALHKADMLKQAVVEAEQKGLQEEAQQLAQQVVMEEAKAEKLAEEGVPTGFDVNESAFPMVDFKTESTPEKVVLEKPLCAEEVDMTGYPGNEYANY
jgi:colicin import membrane protein